MARIFGTVVSALVIGVVGCGSDAAPSASNTSSALGSSGGASVFSRRSCDAPSPGAAACQVLVVTNAQGAEMPTNSPVGLGPSDLASAYSIPSTASTATIAIVDAFDDPNAERDLAMYRSQYGLPPCTSANGCFKKVGESGSTTALPLDDSSWGVEISLDLDMASAACPSCKILLVEAYTSDFIDLANAVDTAVRLGATVVSNSYGGVELGTETGLDVHYDHPGVGIFASTGDAGFGAQYPAASPFVTAVGGTTLSRTSSGRGWSESAWSGAGAGCSAYEPKPSWQRDTGCAHRTVGDVSAVADPSTPVAIYDTFDHGGWMTVGGTSVSTPLVASIMAATQNGARTPAFSYSLRQRRAFNDVTSGTDGTCSPAYLCAGTPGYDGPTGNGTPNAAAFARPVNGTGDFNGDGIADVLFRETATGEVHIWQMSSGGQIALSYPVNTLGFDWDVQATGDFNGDGITDILLRSSTSGTVQMWQMNKSGTIQSSYPVYQSLGFDWQIQGTGDFNGDGTTDIIFRNTSSGTVQIWQMSKYSLIASSYPVVGNLGFDWQLEGTGDFNGDGVTDVLFRNLGNGTVQIWQMNRGGTLASSYSPLPNATLDFQIDGVGDFNGDGISDVLARSSSNGTVVIWLMNRQGMIGLSNSVASNYGSRWLVDGAGDFNGDHVADVILRDAATGTTQIWQMNHTGSIGSSYAAATNLDPAWQIQGLN